MPSTRNHITGLILHKYYPLVKTLQNYLLDILLTEPDTTPPFLPTPSDSAAYHALLSESLVATTMGANTRSKITGAAFSAIVGMQEIIDQAQERLFKLKAGKNVITTGYRLSSKDGDRGKKGMARMGITNYFVNTIITALQAPEWESLLQRVGEDAMLHLLTEVSVFIPLPNGSLCQMIGEPIIYLIPTMPGVAESSESQDATSTTRQKRAIVDDDHGDARPAKRQKLNAKAGSTNPPNNTSTSIQHPADIAFSRSRMFYARPNLIPHTNQIVVGLPLKHVLNRLVPSYRHSKETQVQRPVELDIQKQEENSRHVAKHIFARQYCLSNPFRVVSGKSTIMSFPDYMDREVEIKAAGSCKTPKRLKEMLLLVEKLIWRHGKCGYKPLRNKACPSKLRSTGSKNLDSSIILELMSERSVQFQSQAPQGTEDMSIDTSGNPITPFGLTQAERHAKMKPRFVEFTCSHIEVYRYVALVTNAVIPKSFWGSETNFKLVLRHVKSFISCRRYETLTLHHVLQGFSTSACDWLLPPNSSAKQQPRVSVSDALKRRELLEEFLFWYFDSFVLQLLKTTFYISESSALRNHVLYFRQDDWASLCAPLIDRLTETTFQKIPDADATELLRQRKLGFSFVRLLPKETGVRPIVNLRRRKAKGNYSSEQSINQILQGAFHILTYERKNQPHLLGASVFGPDDIHAKLTSLKAQLHADKSGNLPKLYFVKVDVQACFDTIDQTRLLEILHKLISEDVYIIQRYGQVSMSAGRIKRTYAKSALPEDENPHFLEQASTLAKVLHNTIFVDQVKYPHSKKQEILQLLEEHITENIVKIGHHYYRQTVGIPQGSILSALLCSFFYGDLERLFEQFTKAPQSALLRLIDDYLFITACPSTAKRFLDMMDRGHPEYGCFISKEKTMTNFDYGTDISNVILPQEKNFLWCGFAINMKNLSVSVDYSRYYTSALHTTLTVDRGRRPGTTFAYKMLQLARAKSHFVYLDVNLNTERVVYLNIYQNFLLSAMKMQIYLNQWGSSWKCNPAFIYNTVQKAIIYSYSTIRGQLKRKSVQPNRNPAGISKSAVIWLGNHAFHAVIGRKPGNYVKLLKSLQFELSRPRYRRYQKRFSRLVKDGQVALVPIE